MPVWEESGTAIKTHNRFSALVEVIDAADEIADTPSAFCLNGGSGHLFADDTVISNVEPGQMQTNPSRRNLKEFTKSAKHQAAHGYNG